jgi:hypothetical protein
LRSTISESPVALCRPVGEHRIMSPATIARTVVRGDGVRSWRFEQLLRCGYPAYDALVLSARREIDLHAAARLLHAGCSVELALRILL